MVAQLFFTFTETEFRELIQEEFKKAFAVYLTKQQQNAPSSPELLSRKETAEYFGISLVTLNNWTKTGIVKGFRIGCRVRYRKSDVLNALQEIRSLKYRRLNP